MIDPWDGKGKVNGLLLDVCVPFREDKGELLVEAQAWNGMRLWAENFERITITAPIAPKGFGDGSSIVWRSPASLLAQGRLKFEPLPWGYHPRDHWRLRKQMHERFSALIDSHRYLCFSNIAAFGGWGGMAADIAYAKRRPYCLWFDWVLHRMAVSEGSGLKTRIRNKVYAAMIKRTTDRTVARCTLGMFHGKTVFDAYAPLCTHPELVHDIHVHPGDAISDSALESRLASMRTRERLRIGYLGRVHPMKAPKQWVDAIGEVVQQMGSDRLEAVWLGDGPLLAEMREYVKQLGLEACIKFPGFVSDREAILDFLRGLDAFVFTHITMESPRCLIEALISGVPLIGYDSSYVRELVDPAGGAALRPIGDVKGLGQLIAELIADRQQVSDLTLAAAKARAVFNDEVVFAHRSELIKKYL